MFLYDKFQKEGMIMQEVNVWVSEYRWVCPECGHVQTEDDVAEQVDCGHCGETFYVKLGIRP